jgi:MerR family mercuric resistance operon transcriptional regulator
MTSSSNSYTIGRLAAAAGVATSTVRFYERKGFLKPDARSAGGNYRQYGELALRRLRFIRAAQATGFSLKDIRELLGLAYAETNEPPCAEVMALARKRLGEVRQRVKELRQVERLLSRSIDQCCQSDGDLCVEVNRLRGAADPACRPAPKKAGGAA